MTDQTKTLQALQMAVNIEIEGKAFYLKASKESTSDLGKKLLAKLANEEDRHKRTFESIYEALRLSRVGLNRLSTLNTVRILILFSNLSILPQNLLHLSSMP